MKKIGKEWSVGSRQSAFVAWYPDEECFVNLAGNYKYLEMPYYISQDYEARGESIRPTCRDMLDAYVTPILLVRAQKAGMAIPAYYITNDFFEPPVIIDPVNPFMIKSTTILKPGREQTVARSMTRNFTYAICCQEIPPGAKVAHFRSVLGWSTNRRFRELSKTVWKVFNIPLARVRVVVTGDGEQLISDISPLFFNSLTISETVYLSERLQWVG